MTDFTLLLDSLVPRHKRDTMPNVLPEQNDLLKVVYDNNRKNNAIEQHLARSPNSHNIPYDNNQIPCGNNYAGGSNTSSSSTPTSWSFPSSGSYVGYGSEGVFQS